MNDIFLLAALEVGVPALVVALIVYDYNRGGRLKAFLTSPLAKSLAHQVVIFTTGAIGAYAETLTPEKKEELASNAAKHIIANSPPFVKALIGEEQLISTAKILYLSLKDSMKKFEAVEESNPKDEG